MEREQWRVMRAALRRLPRWWPRAGVYSNREILAVLLWAALHERSVSRACRRACWPVQAWRRRLPDQSTMSRRLRDGRLLEDLRRLASLLRRPGAEATLILDGKPRAVSEFSADADAAGGWGAGTYARGYKLHVLIDASQRLVAWDVRPMNQAECVVAADPLRAAAGAGQLGVGRTVLADASYDSNPLHRVAAASGLRLLAPTRPGMGLAKNRRHEPGRVAAIGFTEHDPSWRDLRLRVRTQVERHFGALACGGLFALPPWARRLHRVRLWVGAKLACHAANQLRRTALAA